MKPDWDKLMSTYAADKDLLIADVDCTTQASLCSKNGVRGYPTIKYGRVDDMKQYSGGRSFAALESFTKGSLKKAGDDAIAFKVEKQEGKDIQGGQDIGGWEIGGHKERRAKADELKAKGKGKRGVKRSDVYRMHPNNSKQMRHPQYFQQISRARQHGPAFKEARTKNERERAYNAKMKGKGGGKTKTKGKRKNKAKKYKYGKLVEQTEL